MKSSHKNQKYAVEAWNWNKSLTQSFRDLFRPSWVVMKIPVWNFHSFFTCSTLILAEFSIDFLSLGSSYWTRISDVSSALQKCVNQSRAESWQFLEINYETFIHFRGGNWCVPPAELSRSHWNLESCRSRSLKVALRKWEFIFHFPVSCLHLFINQKLLKLNLWGVYEIIKFQVKSHQREHELSLLSAVVSSCFRLSTFLVASCYHWRIMRERPRLWKVIILRREEKKNTENLIHVKKDTIAVS